MKIHHKINFAERNYEDNYLKYQSVIFKIKD